MKKTPILFAAIPALLLILTVSCATAIKPVTFESWDIHTEAQRQWLDADDYTKPHLYGAKGAVEMSLPVSPTFEWKYSGISAKDVAYATLAIGEEPSLDGADVYEIPAGQKSFTVADGAMNLKVNTTYYWQITAVLADGTSLSSPIEQFTTDGGIRNISVDGVTNFRDMGGYTTSDGGTVRQGLIYRSGRFNVKYRTKLEITDKGLEQIRRLGIVTDIDLRGDKSENLTPVVYANGYPVDGSVGMVSPLGEDVNYVFIPREWDSTLLNGENGASMIREVFEVLSDEANYPVVFHCSIGTDRTGVTAFLIGCALGLSDDDLMRDYFFSNFGNISTSRLLSNFQAAIYVVSKYHEGSTYAEKGVDYLLKNGVTQEQIDALRSIMIEY